MTSIGGDGLIYGSFCIGCVLPVISASRLCCRQTLLLLPPLVLDMETRVVVVVVVVVVC